MLNRVTEKANKKNHWKTTTIQSYSGKKEKILIPIIILQLPSGMEYYDEVIGSLL